MSRGKLFAVVRSFSIFYMPLSAALSWQEEVRVKSWLTLKPSLAHLSSNLRQCCLCQELALHVWDLEKTYRRWLSCRSPKRAVRGTSVTSVVSTKRFCKLQTTKFYEAQTPAMLVFLLSKQPAQRTGKGGKWEET